MRLNIFTFPNPLDQGDWPAVWALVVEGSPSEHGLRCGVLASGSDERAASNAALVAWWRREDERVQAENATKLNLGPTELTEKPRRSAIARYAVRHLLREAITARSAVRLRYTDASGNTTTRTIKPSELTSDLVTAYDVSKDEARTFRLDRINYVEII